MSQALHLPPLPPLELEAPLPEETFHALWKVAQRSNERLERKRQEYQQAGHPWRGAAPITENGCRLVFEAMQRDLRRREGDLPAYLYVDDQVAAEFKQFVERPELKLIHIVRLARLCGWIDPGRRDWHALAADPFEALLLHYRNTHEKFGLRELAAALEAIGVSGDVVGKARLNAFGRMFCWEDEAVWPYFAERMELLERRLRPPKAPATSDDYWLRYEKECAFQVLQAFPEIPPSLIELIWDAALGSAKTDRAAAQAILQKAPAWKERVVAALHDGQYVKRAVAAEWLARQGDSSAIEPLVKALQKEKQDAAKAAIMDALERLGAPIDHFLDRGVLAKEAEKTLKKGIPAQLEWFPWDALPQVHWKDTGEPVAAEVVKHFLLQAFRLKSPEPSPLLRRYCAMFVPAERERLGEFVFQRWLDRDLERKYTDEEARRLAKANAGQFSWMGLAPQELEDHLFQTYRREVGSATKEKGLLAVAAACCGREAVRKIEAYLKEWYGYRAPQCKALVAMLSAIEHPAAVQLLLATANRFRTRGIRQEAEKYVHWLAERNEWTIDQLADRTIPTAGFDETGQAVLDYGPRRFTAVLDDKLNVTLKTEEGKTLKSLPAPGKQDDEEQAKAAKKEFSSLKKELKQIVKQQTERLYESMCTQRQWRFEEWDEHLHRHPIMRVLCRRVVWAVMDGDAAAQTFRPLEDGSLTDAHDQEVRLAPDAVVRLAHGAIVAPETADAWLAHFADYRVAPLFVQFGRDVYRLPEDRKQAAEINDFEGWLVEAFTLRGLASKAGYTRGQTEDGGWFFEYLKRFAGLGLEAVIRFSGNGLPETNRTVALQKLCFTRVGPQETPGRQRASLVPLGELPPVLLSECYHDLQTIAATGPGYDPDWEKKIG